MEDMLERIRKSRIESEKMIDGIKNKSENDDNKWKAVIIRVDDVKLLNFLKTEYPEIWEKFKVKLLEEDENE